MAIEPADLWNSVDYRSFLRRWFEREKTTRPALSFRFLGRKLSMDPSLLAKILQGERHLSTSRIQPVCDLVGLSGREAEYFRHLVLHAKSKSAREAQACQERLHALRSVSPVATAADRESYWEKWIHVAVRELLSCGEFKDEWARMGALLQPRQSARAVREAVRRLETLGLVRKDPSGVWRGADAFVKSPAAPSSGALRGFHRQAILLALETLEGLPPSERNITSLTVSVPEEGYARIVELAREFRGQVLSAVAGMRSPSRVLQLNIQLFPLSVGDRGEWGEA